ncbi:hypothetical protein U6A24_07395 [Aquimarina gracilis]|uniref:Natural product n=1 Tax=Aquimarina gracilis TaxID=874422 RepID=A0ABU5ZV28_9FLAO|nr:hypothetical protein [Aquimarina gracilis]MEB3345277.1 hypothetical protein [Aquimarina gracilis]
MKTNKKRLSLEKIEIAKLQSSKNIIGGQDLDITIKHGFSCFLLGSCNSTLTDPVGEN